VQRVGGEGVAGRPPPQGAGLGLAALLGQLAGQLADADVEAVDSPQHEQVRPGVGLVDKRAGGQVGLVGPDPRTSVRVGAVGVDVGVDAGGGVRGGCRGRGHVRQAGEEGGQRGRGVHGGEDGVDGVPRVVVEAAAVGDVDQLVVGLDGGAQVVGLARQRAQRPRQLVEVDERRRLRAGRQAEQDRGDAVRPHQRRPQDGPEQLALQVDPPGGRRAGGELLGVRPAELGARPQQPPLQDLVADLALLQLGDQLVRPAPDHRALGLVARPGDVGDDRPLGLVAVDDVGERPVDQPVDGAERPRLVRVELGLGELAGQLVRVLDRAVLGPLRLVDGGAEQAAADQLVEPQLGRPLGALDVELQGAHQHADRRVGGAEEELAVLVHVLGDQGVVEPAGHVALRPPRPVARLVGLGVAVAAAGDQPLQHPLADPAGVRDAGVLVAGEGGEGGDDVVVAGARVEVHPQRHHVDGVETQLDEVEARPGLAAEAGLVGLQVVERPGVGDRPRPHAERGDGRRAAEQRRVVGRPAAQVHVVEQAGLGTVPEPRALAACPAVAERADVGERGGVEAVGPGPGGGGRARGGGGHGRSPAAPPGGTGRRGAHQYRPSRPAPATAAHPRASGSG
jgi:hypothetical protein